jgi:hypothetical protein
LQAEFLMNVLKAGYAKGALINMRNVDSVNYSDTRGRSLLIYASKNGFAKVCKIVMNGWDYRACIKSMIRLMILLYWGLRSNPLFSYLNRQV